MNDEDLKTIRRACRRWGVRPTARRLGTDRSTLANAALGTMLPMTAVRLEPAIRRLRNELEAAEAAAEASAK